ncbi:hypothetical protein BYZ73_12750 [Rhodovulum viride]|uniref:Uncharacterized protein n=1 Tax=Rhodovulum viride TaxID=1231134 RepID=A0ABX9DHG6_9RHOB|nr:hypothetical protein [Rhodovulum viride]RAP40836.1 hypothetical protein BYZ73_12750 [Rhodovulum viride]
MTPTLKSAPLLAAILALGMTGTALAQADGGTQIRPRPAAPMAQQDGSGQAYWGTGRSDRHQGRWADDDDDDDDDRGWFGFGRDDDDRGRRDRSHATRRSGDCDSRGGRSRAQAQPAPGSVAPPANGLFNNGAAPRAQSN